MKLSKISTHGDDKYLGSEPSWTDQQGSLISSFTWYNYFCNRKDAKAFILDYMKSVSRPKEEIAAISSLSDSDFDLQCAWLARMMCIGYIPDDRAKSYFADQYKGLIAKTKIEKPKKKVESTAVVINIQDRINEKAQEEMGEIEGFIDDFVLGGCRSSGDVTNLMKSRQYSSVVAKRICDAFVKRAKEIEEVLEGDDDQLKEGYSNFTKPELKRFKELLDTIVGEANRLSVVNKPVRKKRKVKEKPASVVVAKMKYLKEFPELNLKSIPPEKIIGSFQVWTYNTKTKLLGVYNADNAKGLTVKGSTFQNFNEQTSIGKRLRKPDVVLKDLVNAGKIRLKKILPELKTKESILTGRMNSDTIIVRVL